MQLKLVQAAHIVPVHVSGSNDFTSNGLALCATHHLAYDGGLLGVAPDYRILINQARLNQIDRENLADGRELVLQYVSGNIKVPDRASDRPGPEYLARGLHLRGWEQDSMRI